MGLYLNGQHGEGPELPRKGKLDVLVRSYGAELITRRDYEGFERFACWPRGKRLVIVREFFSHDAALVIDRAEWDYLHNYPGELFPTKHKIQFMLMPVEAVDAMLTGSRGGGIDWGEESDGTEAACGG